MLERVSALAGVARFERDGIRIAEFADFTLTQVAGDPKSLKSSFPGTSEQVGIAVVTARATIMRVGLSQLWVVETRPEHYEGLYATPLTSSRTRISLEGSSSRAVLAKCAAIDFHPTVFTPGRFVMTGIHHMPVLIHCVEPDSFHVYGLRTFALSLWEVLVDAGHS